MPLMIGEVAAPASSRMLLPCFCGDADEDRGDGFDLRIALDLVVGVGRQVEETGAALEHHGGGLVGAALAMIMTWKPSMSMLLSMALR